MKKMYRKVSISHYFRMNRLAVLPRGFGAFPVLEVLDLTYNNLDESTLPGNFFMMGKHCTKNSSMNIIIIMT